VQYDTVGRLYQRKHTLMPERDLDALFPTLSPVPTAFDAFECDAADPEAVAQWTRWNELKVHLARVLAKVDRASMYNSLEVRVPLLDREVIEVAWQTDWQTCFDPASRTGKRVLRRALSKRVQHQAHAKRGFTVPIADWLVGSLAGHVRELLLDRDAILGTPIHRAHMAALVTRLRGGDHSIAWGIWLLLSLALWERKFGRAS
jgi:asparagine synthase (glutamine-hydrolysing)